MFRCDSSKNACPESAPQPAHASKTLVHSSLVPMKSTLSLLALYSCGLAKNVVEQLKDL
jgi:hypothetical protein